MPLPAGIHRLARRYGVDLTQLRFEDSKWAAYMKLLESLEPDVVVDVGANSGQFASELRLAGYSGPIVSFEPVSDAFRKLALKAASDPAWTAINCALGAAEGEVTINVSANSMSSSLLGMSEMHTDAAPDSKYVRQERIRVRRLEEVAELDSFHRIFCKVDTQGYERQVLEGVSALWPRLIAVQLETSHVGLYEDSWMHHDVMAYFEAIDWEPVFVDRGFTDSRTGRMLQSDWTFAPAERARRDSNPKPSDP